MGLSNMRPFGGHRDTSPSSPSTLVAQLGWKHSCIAFCAEYLQRLHEGCLRSYDTTLLQYIGYHFCCSYQDTARVLHFELVEMITFGSKDLQGGQLIIEQKR